MKVLVVVHGFPPSAQGGSEIYAELHARTLSDRYGDDVLVITREHDPAAAEYRVRIETRAGLRVAWLNNTFRATRSFDETYANHEIESVAASLIDEFRPDVAHLHHLTCLSTTIVDLLARRGVPICFTLHDYWLLCHRGQLLDRDLRVCPGPEPGGCEVCLDDAASVGRLGFAAAATLRSAGSWLPSALVRRVRRGAGRIVRAPPHRKRARPKPAGGFFICEGWLIGSRTSSHRRITSVNSSSSSAFRPSESPMPATASTIVRSRRCPATRPGASPARFNSGSWAA